MVMYGNIGQVSCLMSTLMGGVSGSALQMLRWSAASSDLR